MELSKSKFCVVFYRNICIVMKAFNSKCTIQVVDGRGRCVIANSDIYPGEIIVSEQPYAAVVSSPYSEVCCYYCMKLCINGTIFALSSDDPVRYCSAQCMNADNALHATEVKAVNEVFSGPNSIVGGGDSLRLVLRIAALRSLDKSNPVSSSVGSLSHPHQGSSSTFADIESLESRSDSMDAAALDQIAEVSQYIESILAKTIPSTSSSSMQSLTSVQIQSLLLALQCNAHQILSSSRRPIGLGIFPLTSMLNHSCFPNCSHNFMLLDASRPTLIMRAIALIPAGSELCYSYCPLYESRSTRQTKLRAAYGFDCNCCRCCPVPTVGIENPSILSTCCDDSVLDVDASMNMNVSVTSAAWEAVIALVSQCAAALQSYDDHGCSDYLQPSGHTSLPTSASTASISTLTTSSAETNSVLPSLAAAALVHCEQLVSQLTSPLNRSLLADMNPANSMLMSCYSVVGRIACMSCHHSLLPTSDPQSMPMMVVGLRCAQLALGCLLKYGAPVRMQEIGTLEMCVAKLMFAVSGDLPSMPVTDDSRGSSSSQAAVAVFIDTNQRLMQEKLLDMFANVLLENIAAQQDAEFTTAALVDCSEPAIAELFRCSCLLAVQYYQEHVIRDNEEDSDFDIDYNSLRNVCLQSAMHTLFVSRIS